MSSKNKAPIDGYSREEYEQGLEEINRGENALASLNDPEHPLQKEIAQHAQWKSEYGGSHYILSEEEQRTKNTLEENTSHIETKIELAKNNLRRLLSNAQSEAMTYESEKIAKEIVPKIEEIKNNFQTIKEEPIDLPPGVHKYVDNIINEAENAAIRIKEKPLQPPSTIRKIYEDLLELIREFARSFVDILGQDKFGGPRGSQPV